MLKRVLMFLAAATLCGCNSSDGTRFSDQVDYYVLSSSAMTLSAFGASSPDDEANQTFQCPAASGLSRESNVTFFEVRANSLTPHFLLDATQGIRSDTSNAVGISIRDIQMGMLDVYKRCQSTSSEQYVTYCPSSTYTIVDNCANASDPATSCELVHKGTHRLVVSSVVNDNAACYSEENDRTAYNKSTAREAYYACDAFTPINLLGVYRGTPPSNNCCNEETSGPTLDFCFKPCGCRTLTVQFLPKETPGETTTDNDDTTPDDAEATPQPTEAPTVSQSIDPTLRIAVFSNVEGNTDVFKKILEDAKANNVNLAISLGNLTKSGKASQYEEMRDIADRILSPTDGSTCTKDDGDVCCTNNERQFSYLCNAHANGIPLIAGLGESEVDGSGLSTYRKLFGVSNMATVVGKVELLMIDTADATLSSAEKEWIKDVFAVPKEQTCSIEAPTQMSSWPMLSACSSNSGTTPSCRSCIDEEAYCIPPDNELSDTTKGPQNCVCVPLKSDICRMNQKCPVLDGTKQTCVCTRDQDCDIGGSCIDGVCQMPMRFVFSYSPLFDEFGSRNNALAREDAAALISIFAKANTSAIFSGRILDYSSFKKAGIPIYITGGGGAKMSSFSDYGHHWLLLEIPNAYTAPNDFSVKVMKL